MNGARVPDFDNCRSFAVASESARKKREGEKRNKWRAGQRAKEEERLDGRKVPAKFLEARVGKVN